MSTASTVFDRVFQEKGIPLYIESESGYFDAAEIRTLVSMLSIVDNSYVDYDLAAVLRSPLVGLDEEELAVIVGEYRSRYEKNGTDWNARLYDKVIDYMDTHVGEKKHAVDRPVSYTHLDVYKRQLQGISYGIYDKSGSVCAVSGRCYIVHGRYVVKLSIDILECRFKKWVHGGHSLIHLFE